MRSPVPKQAVEMVPTKAHGHRNLGACLASVGDLNGGEGHLDPVRIYPTDQQALLGLAMTQKRQGRSGAARITCGKIIEIAPQIPLAEHAKALH